RRDSVQGIQSRCVAPGLCRRGNCRQTGSCKMTSFKILLEDRNVQKVFRVFELEGHGLRLIGGCVRDALLKRPIGDKDFATTATPQQMMVFLPKYGISAIPTGL